MAGSEGEGEGKKRGRRRGKGRMFEGKGKEGGQESRDLMALDGACWRKG